MDHEGNYNISGGRSGKWETQNKRTGRGAIIKSQIKLAKSATNYPAIQRFAKLVLLPYNYSYVKLIMENLILKGITWEIPNFRSPSPTPLIFHNILIERE